MIRSSKHVISALVVMYLQLHPESSVSVSSPSGLGRSVGVPGPVVGSVGVPGLVVGSVPGLVVVGSVPGPVFGGIPGLVVGGIPGPVVVGGAPEVVVGSGVLVSPSICGKKSFVQDVIYTIYMFSCTVSAKSEMLQYLVHM